MAFSRIIFSSLPAIAEFYNDFLLYARCRFIDCFGQISSDYQISIAFLEILLFLRASVMRLSL